MAGAVSKSLGACLRSFRGAWVGSSRSVSHGHSWRSERSYSKLPHSPNVWGGLRRGDLRVGTCLSIPCSAQACWSKRRGRAECWMSGRTGRCPSCTSRKTPPTAHNPDTRFEPAKIHSYHQDGNSAWRNIRYTNTRAGPGVLSRLWRPSLPPLYTPHSLLLIWHQNSLQFYAHPDMRLEALD